MAASKGILEAAGGIAILQEDTVKQNRRYMMLTWCTERLYGPIRTYSHGQRSPLAKTEPQRRLPERSLPTTATPDAGTTDFKTLSTTNSRGKQTSCKKLLYLLFWQFLELSTEYDALRGVLRGVKREVGMKPFGILFLRTSSPSGFEFSMKSKGLWQEPASRCGKKSPAPSGKLSIEKMDTRGKITSRNPKEKEVCSCVHIHITML